MAISEETMRKVCDYPHPLAIAERINKGVMPWAKEWKNPAEHRPTVSEMIEKFGRAAIKAAMKSGNIYAEKNRKPLWDIDECIGDEFVSANGVVVG